MNGSRVQADFVDIKREFVGDQELLLIFLHKEFSSLSARDWETTELSAQEPSC